MAEPMLIKMVVVLVFYFARRRVAPGLLHPGFVFIQICTQTRSNMHLPQWKMPGFKPGFAATSKHCSKTLQWYFAVAKTDTVTDAQRGPHDLYPGIVPVEECAIVRTGVLYADKAVISQFNAGMQTRYCRLLKHQIT